MPDFSFLREYTRRGGDTTVEYGEVSFAGNVWTTVVSLTPAADRIMTSFGADLVALLSTTYRFRVLLDGVVKWHEVASTTSVGAIVARMRVPAGSTLEVQVLHAEATATLAGGSISHEPV